MDPCFSMSINNRS